MRHALRRILRGAGLAVLAIGLMGMGALGGGGRDNGLPARDFRATFTDVDGTRVDVSRVNAGGDASLEGDVGRGRLRVPFDNIVRIRLAATGQDRDRVSAEVTLREGDPVQLIVRSSTTFYGQTQSGAYQIRARDLRSVEFAQK
jgi:hypothetical protein